MAKRFRGFMPVVVDVETAGFNAKTDALLEVAALPIIFDEESGLFKPGASSHFHIEPFPGANIDPKALEFNGIKLDHPFRLAEKEDEALKAIFKVIRDEMKTCGCHRAVLVGHNAFFDLGFINEAIARNKIKRSPFHAFTTFDTAALSALAVGQTVLARACKEAGIKFDPTEAHSALYDAERTAELFCWIVNRWESLVKLEGHS